MAETPPRSIAAVLGAPDSKMFCDNARSFENHAYAKHCRDVLKQTDVTTFRPWDELELKAERRVDLIAIVRIAVSPAPLGAALHGGKDALVKTILAHPMPAFVYFEKPKERTAAKNDYGWDGTGYMTEKQRNEAADAANGEKLATAARDERRETGRCAHLGADTPSQTSSARLAAVKRVRKDDEADASGETGKTALQLQKESAAPKRGVKRKCPWCHVEKPATDFVSDHAEAAATEDDEVVEVTLTAVDGCKACNSGPMVELFGSHKGKLPGLPGLMAPGPGSVAVNKTIVREHVEKCAKRARWGSE